MARVKILDKEFETSIPEEQLLTAIDAVAQKINAELNGKDPLFLCILNGAFMFASDLMKRVNVPSRISFVKLASYQGTESSGVMKELIGLNEDIKGKTIVIVEDIVDTGATMAMLLKQLKERGAGDIKIATLMFKPESCRPDIKPDYVAINIPNDFIVGYGLDYDGYGRNLRDIYTIVK